jgi:Ca2+-binding RTX toxin-like protein
MSASGEVICTIRGTSVSESLVGTAGPDVICAGGGDDSVTGRGGNDIVYGGRGSDTVKARGGADTVYGGSGGDTLDGAAGDDSLFGQLGADMLQGGAGNDALDGGLGNDTLDGGSGTNSCDGGGGDDTLLDNCDATAPKLERFSFSPTAIDTSMEAQAITFKARVTDDLAGVSEVVAIFRSPGTQALPVWFPVLAPEVPGNDYERTVTVPQYSEQGTWKLDYIYVQDAAHNQKWIDHDEALASGFPVSFEQTGEGDSEPPVLRDFTFSPGSIDTSLLPQPIKFSARITDDVTGFNYGGISFRSPAGTTESVSLDAWGHVPALGQEDVYENTWPFPAHIPQGTWTVEWFFLEDHAGNRISYNTAELEARGFPTTLVQTGPGDSTPPVFHSLSFAPREINTSAAPQAIVFTGEFSDDIAGFHEAVFDFESPTGVQHASAIMLAEVPGLTLKTTYVGTLVLPRYAEHGTWRLIRAHWNDKVYNSRYNVQPEWFAERGIATTFYNGPAEL